MILLQTIDYWCLVYPDSVWTKSQQTQIAGPKVFVWEGGYGRNEMRAFKWTMTQYS
jgi:hypothetical protein